MAIPLLPSIRVDCDCCLVEGEIPAFKSCVRCICCGEILLRPLGEDSGLMYIWMGTFESIRIVPKDSETFHCYDCYRSHRIHKSSFSTCCKQKIYFADVCKEVPERKSDIKKAQNRPSKSMSSDTLLKALEKMSDNGEKKVKISELDKLFKEWDEENAKTELIKELEEDSEKQEERIKYLEKLAARELHKVKELEEKEMVNMDKLEELKMRNEDIQVKLQEEEQKTVDLMWEVMDKEKELLASEEMVEKLKKELEEEREKNKKIEEEVDGLKEELQNQNNEKKKDTDKEVEFLRDQVAKLININALLVKKITN